MDAKAIKKLAIFPAIGIVRIGNSPEYFFSSDIPGVAPAPEGGFKDGNNLFKKQVQRFRIYAFDDNDQPLGELTLDAAEIDWRVHIANRKAGWYQFNNALDMGNLSISSSFRNGGVTGEDRAQLIIDPGIRHITGRNSKGSSYQFDSGTFMGKKVSLGEIQTDEAGRLLVFGGDGKSESQNNAPAITFANNDGWHDDISDGTVRATVTINGEQIEATPAFVVCTPPNFAPGLFPTVTMYDVVYDLYVREGWLKAPDTITFFDNIFPILKRTTDAQWVNEGFFMLFGTNSPSDFSNPELIKALSDPSPEYKQKREYYFSWFRNTFSAKYQPSLIPPYYGDLFGEYEDMPHVDLSVTSVQYEMLRRWAEGDFTTGTPPAPVSFEEMSPAEQITALLKAPLEECLGGPFHPGIEITWPFRNLIFWESPFRIKILPEDKPVCDDYGYLLTPAIATGENGPLDGSGPGSITRWLGVPWQTDEASCLSGYDATLYLPLPSFWATRVPNYVLSMDSFDRSTTPTLNTGQRLKHFSYRVDWLRDFPSSYVGRINAMVAKWHQLGVIAKAESGFEEENSFLPTEWWVETSRKTPAGVDPTFQQVLRAEEASKDLPQGVKAFKVDLLESAPESQPRESRAVGRHEM